MTFLPILQSNIIVDLDHLACVVVPDEPRFVKLQVPLQKLQLLQLKLVFRLTILHPRLQRQLCKLFYLVQTQLLFNPTKLFQLHKLVKQVANSGLHKLSIARQLRIVFRMHSARTQCTSQQLHKLNLPTMTCPTRASLSLMAIIRKLSGHVNAASTRNSLIQKTSCSSTTMGQMTGVTHISLAMKNAIFATLGMFGRSMSKTSLLMKTSVLM